MLTGLLTGDRLIVVLTPRQSFDTFGSKFTKNMSQHLLYFICVTSHITSGGNFK